MKNKSSGFTLVEVLIVVAIVAILAAVALPSYNSSVERGRRSDGQSALLDTASKMETYYFTNKTYTTDLTELGYAAAAGVATPEGHYTLSVSAETGACPIVSCYQLRATAGNAQLNDGDLTLDSAGRKLPNDKW